ncbi:17900_t:CDS:1, partial [Cetraspora pellucida]
SKDWSLKEALLACKKINEKNTGENIKNTLEKVIEQFQLKQKLIATIMDNSMDVVKAI